MQKKIIVPFRPRAEERSGLWARFVTFGRKQEITSSVGSDHAIDSALLKSLANHRYALVINERSVSYRGRNIETPQMAYAFGPIGLVWVAAESQEFGFGGLMRHFGRERRKNPMAMSALRAFIAQLDPAILKSLKRAHALDSGTYNWCLIDPERRARAIDSYPALTEQLLEHRSCDMAIALSGSLEQALAAEIGEPAGVVRHVGRRAPTMFGQNLKSAMDLMGRVPQDLWPQSRAEVERFVGAEKACDNHFSSRQTPLPFIIDTLRSSDDLWRAGSEYGFSQSFNDALHSLVTALLMPMIIGHKEPAKESIATQLWNRHSRTQASRMIHRGLVLELAGNGGLNPLHRFSDAWHERFQVLDRKSGELPLELGIPTLGGSAPTEIDGVTYRPLGTLAALKAESAEMKHCIETYGRQVIRCDTFPFACDGAAGRFTMTIRRKNDGTMKLDDARGLKDAEDDAWTAAAERLVTHMIKANAQPVGGEEMQALLAKSDGPSIWIHTPKIALDIFEENFARWMPIMPTRLRARRPEDFLGNPTANVVRKYLLSRAKKAKATQPTLIAA